MVLPKKQVIIWLCIGCILIWLMVVVGGITRLTHSGLSMVNWSVFGNFPPHSEEQWQSSFNAYKTSPEYKQINSYFGLEDFKSIYWWEYIHRTIGRMIGVVFLIPFIYFLLRFKIPRPLLLKLTCIFCLGGLQGLLGWYMVKSGLVNDPHVSHYRLAAHLLTAFITFGFTLWVILELKINNEKLIMKNEENPINSNTTYPLPSKGCAIKRWSYLLLIFIVVQIIYGALTAGLRAGQFDTTFPKMGSSWIAPEVTSLSPLWRNFTEGVAGVQFIHRYNAYIVVIITCVLWFKSFRQKLNASQRKGINFLLWMVVVQFLLGVFTLIYSVPVVLGVLHQTGAFLLFAGTIFVIHRFSHFVSLPINPLPS